MRPAMALWRVLDGRDGVVLRKNGKGVDQYLVAVAVTALEGQGLLLRRTVLPAQEAGPGLYGCRIGPGQGGYCPGRVELYPDGIPSMTVCLVCISCRSRYLCAASGHAASCLYIRLCIVFY